jgi:hypothetical protein
MQNVIADDIKADAENERNRVVGAVDAVVIDPEAFQSQGNGNEQQPEPKATEPY